MISITPNVRTIYVKRVGDTFYNRLGEPVAAIVKREHFSNINLEVELEMSFKPVDHRASVEAEIERANERIDELHREQLALYSKLVKLEQAEMRNGDACAGKEDKA